MDRHPIAQLERWRRAERVEAARERLAALSPGGSPDRPLDVISAAVIEPRAYASMPCPHCGGQYRVNDHTRPIPGIRRLDVACRRCGVARALWFRLVSPESDN